MTKSNYQKGLASPHVLIFKQYGKDFHDFHNKLIELKQLTEDKEFISDQIVVKKKLSEVRYAYKKLEFIFDYLEPNFAYLYINGGPLPKLHKEVSEIDIILPNGLQRLDELIFSKDFSISKSEVFDKTNELEAAVMFIKESHLSDTITKQNSIELLRSGMVRVFTLGLTGFDTPGSRNGISESLVSLKAMRYAFSCYSGDLNPEQRFIFNKILSLYQRGIDLLVENDDFDSFDRLYFLKDVVNPIYKELHVFQIAQGIESASLNIHAQNYNTENIFDEDFLDVSYYSQFAYNDINNAASIDLGKLLFYDPILSKNIDLSCSTCHNPKLGFTDGLAKSITNRHDAVTRRNSPTLIDVAYSSKYFWDMREHDLEKQVAHVVEDKLEFNIGFAEIEKRLSQSDQYVKMFDKAFGNISKKSINSRSISNAIASYVNTLQSFNSPFDKYVKNDEVELSNSAKAGFNLFMGKAACGTCHFAPVFNGSVPPFYTDAESEVLGVTVGYDPEKPIIDEDLGRSSNGRKGDAHPHFDNSFKTVTVRNIALTAPYMHNGLFKTLEDVVDFYDKGGGVGLGLNIKNQTLSSEPINLSEVEKSELIDFLHALTDTTGLHPGKIDLPKFRGQPYWNKRGGPKVID